MTAIFSPKALEYTYSTSISTVSKGYARCLKPETLKPCKQMHLFDLDIDIPGFRL